jgi:hypothetical protein
MGVLPTHLQEHAQFPVGVLAWDSLAGASLCIYTPVQLRSRAVMRLKNGLPNDSQVNECLSHAVTSSTSVLLLHRKGPFA